MNATCEDITANHCRGWVRAFKEILFPRAMQMENVRCDFDENLWPDQQEPSSILFSWILLCIFAVT